MPTDGSFSICIADKVIKVFPVFPQTKEHCRDFLCREEAELTIRMTAEDIAAERERSAARDLQEQRSVRSFTDEYLETLALYRKIAEALTEHDILLFHGSCVAVDSQGYLFAAPSGTGKSTHTRLWMERFGGRALMVNDDKPLIAVRENEIRIYGTPWNGKHRLGSNISVPLKAICALRQGAENKIGPMAKHEAISMLLKQIYRPQSRQRLEKSLGLISCLIDQVPIYEMACNMEPQAAEVAYEAMSKTNFEQVLRRRGKLIYTGRGDSMEPLIRQDRDILIIEPCCGRLKKYDIPLYKRDSGAYVLHRILKVRKDDYVLCGDNRRKKEYGITDRHMIGVLTGMVRKGKEISLSHWRCRLYAHLWCDLFFLRAGIIWIREMIYCGRRSIARRRKEDRQASRP